MKKLFLVILALSSFTATADQYTSKKYGFSFEPPTSSGAAAQNHQIAFFTLPPTDGFAPNINIQIQIWGKSLKAYKELSESQFKTMAFRVIRCSQEKGRLTFEYSGKTQGRELHWYSLAIPRDGRMYVVTATALESQWASAGKTLVESVNSFKPDTD